MKCFFKYLCFFFFLLSSDNLIAQTPYFKNYTVKDGLPSNETFEVFQDSKGYIWVGTDKGVARFDGYKFEVYTKDDGLADNTVFGFYEDFKGRIWFRCFNGKLCYFLNGKIITLKCSEQFCKQINNSIITSFHVDKNEKLWVGLTYSEYFIIDLKNQTFSKQDLSITAKENIYLVEVEQGFIWGSTLDEDNSYITKNHSLKLLRNDNKMISEIDLSCFKKPYVNYFFKVVKQDKDYFFFLTNTCIKFNKNKIDTIMEFNSAMFSLFKDKKGIIIGYQKDGFDFKRDKSVTRNCLSNNSITSILKDGEENFWFSSLNNGVFFTSGFSFSDFNIKGQPLETEVKCSENIGDDLWIGLGNGKVINEKSTGKVITHNFNLNKLIAHHIVKISNLKNNIIGLASSNSLIISKNKTVFFKEQGSKYLYSKDIIDINNSYYLIGKNSIFVFDSKRLNCTRKIEFNTVLNGAFYDGSQLWIASSNGIWNLKGDKPIKIKPRNKPIDFRVDAITGDKKGNIYFVSKGIGVFMLRKNLLYNLSGALPTKFFNCLFVDKENLIWSGGNKGLTKIDVTSFEPLKYSVHNFTQRQGIPADEINQIKEKNNILYLATSKGITLFDHADFKNNTTPPPIYITDIQVKDSVYSLRESYKLNYNENYIKINFVGLTYKDAGNTQYKYRLIGLDTNWTTTHDKDANYTTLPYGDYTFEVLAENNDGYWSAKPARVNFSISPPFWQTWWFRILTITGIIVSVFYVTRYRIGLVVKREREKSSLYQKAADMELKFLSSQMNPHFTFNSMNSIQYFLMNNETEKAQRYLVKYSKLIRLVLENNMDTYVALENEIKMLSLYMDIESLRFADKFEYEVLLSDDLNDKSVQIPPMVIQPYIENAIWHGLMHQKNVKGKILLSFSMSESMLKCTVEDNGIGRKRAKELSKPKEHQSLGMLITSARLEKMHATSVKNKINIIDKNDQEGNPCGTIVELLFPFNYG